MRTPQLLVEAPLADATVGTAVPLTQPQRHHLGRVLRRGDGDPVTLADGRGTRVAAALEGEVAVLRASPEHVEPASPAITVLHALPKGRAMDEVVRTLCELGVARIVPVITERTEARPTGDRARSVGERLRSVAVSAFEQAQSAHLCTVDDPRPLTVTESERSADRAGERRLLAHPAATLPLAQALCPDSDVTKVLLLIGPEGGFSPGEVARLDAAGWSACRAGDTVLRTVHAGTVLTAAVMALCGRFGSTGGPMGG